MILHAKTKFLFIISAVAIFTIVVFASPFSVVWNLLDAATIRTTLISSNKAVKTTIASNPKGYPGTGWQRNLTGDGSTALNKSNCQAATGSTPATGWVWFADANGNGTTNDPEDGVCVATTTTSFGYGAAGGWNGATNLATTSAALTATGGTYQTITTGTTLVADRYKYSIVKVTAGTALGCWGIVKTNDTGIITIYGEWLNGSNPPAVCSPTVPVNTDTFQIYDDYKDDNSWIGDYTCSGNFPNGVVVYHNYPPSLSSDGWSPKPSAIEISDCLDGKRDLLPQESDRAIISGTITSINSSVATSTITDSSGKMATSTLMGQKILITGGTGAGSYAIIENNTWTTITAGSNGSPWSSTAPTVGSTYSVIYVVPHASYVAAAGRSYIFLADDQASNKGPLNSSVLTNWKGTRLPSSSDFFGYCGTKSANNFNTAGTGFYYSSGASANTALGKLGSNVARGHNPAPNNNFIDLSNYSYEWLAEQSYVNGAHFTGGNACSYILVNGVSGGSYRFRAIFRP